MGKLLKQYSDEFCTDCRTIVYYDDVNSESAGDIGLINNNDVRRCECVRDSGGEIPNDQRPWIRVDVVITAAPVRPHVFRRQPIHDIAAPGSTPDSPRLFNLRDVWWIILLLIIGGIALDDRLLVALRGLF